MSQEYSQPPFPKKTRLGILMHQRGIAGITAIDAFHLLREFGTSSFEASSLMNGGSGTATELSQGSHTINVFFGSSGPLKQLFDFPLMTRNSLLCEERSWVEVGERQSNCDQSQCLQSKSTSSYSEAEIEGFDYPHSGFVSFSQVTLGTSAYLLPANKIRRRIISPRERRMVRFFSIVDRSFPLIPLGCRNRLSRRVDVGWSGSSSSTLWESVKLAEAADSMRSICSHIQSRPGVLQQAARVEVYTRVLSSVLGALGSPDSTGPPVESSNLGNGRREEENDAKSVSSLAVSALGLGTLPSSRRSFEVCDPPYDLQSRVVVVKWSLAVVERQSNHLLLAKQKELCGGCQRPLVSNFWSPTLYCDYTGLLFCPDCHHNDSRVIPGRAVNAWDLTRRKVCSLVADFLEAHTQLPLISARHDIPRRFFDCDAGIDSLIQFQKLRYRLQGIRKLLACRRCGERGDCDSWLRDASQLPTHMWEDVEFYSLSDLVDIGSGRSHLFFCLKAACEKWTEHILMCENCRPQFGRICLICASMKVLLPFDTSIYCECPACATAFHRKCLQRAHRCPVCISRAIG